MTQTTGTPAPTAAYSVTLTDNYGHREVAGYQFHEEALEALAGFARGFAASWSAAGKDYTQTSHGTDCRVFTDRTRGVVATWRIEAAK